MPRRRGGRRRDGLGEPRELSLHVLVVGELEHLEEAREVDRAVAVVVDALEPLAQPRLGQLGLREPLLDLGPLEQLRQRDRAAAPVDAAGESAASESNAARSSPSWFIAPAVCAS